MKVLILKASSDDEEKDPYVDILKAIKCEAVVVPVLTFEFCNLNLLRDKLQHPEMYCGLICTSPRSVQAIHLSIEDDNTVLSKWSTSPTYVVGESTGKVLQEKLKLTGIGSESGNAERLAEFICNDAHQDINKSLLYPCAEQRRDILPDKLSTAGFVLDMITVYKSIPHPQLDAELNTVFTLASTPDIVVFFSPSGVKYVVPKLRELKVNFEKLKIMSIGPATEEALKSNNLSVHTTVQKPSPLGLLEAIKPLFKT